MGETNFVAGRLTRSELPLAVETAVGVLHSTVEPVEDLSPGDEVVCSVRPEAIRVSDPDTAAGEDAATGEDENEEENVMDGVVRQTVYLGDHEQYSVRLDDGTPMKLVDHRPGRRLAGPGAPVRLKCDASQVVVLGKPG
ncbi:MAG: TOBE domain-containing protein [Gemmatimonadetes bacterium]|nr:TOBE domain-containing protein [Gemmatimonadota bacterium]